MSSKSDTGKADRADPAVVAKAMADPDVTVPTEQPVVAPTTLPTDIKAASVRRPVCVVRLGRGRLGGSTFMDLIIQRARYAGRRVKPLDGDLRSRTLATLYPAHDTDGNAILDGASMPGSEEMNDYKAWMSQEFELMVQEGVSRVIDLGGGERVMQEFVRSFPLSRYCDGYGVDLLPVFLLGPDIEDLNHVVQLVRAGAVRSSRMLLVLNEGVIRSGQTPDGIFDAIVSHPDFLALLAAGAKSVTLHKLDCLDLLRERRFGFYDAAYGRPDPSGNKAGPVLEFLTRIWLEDHEADHQERGSAGWLP